MRSAMTTTSAALLTTAMLGGGCVQQDRYDNLLTANRSLKEQLVTSQDEIATSEANMAEVRRELVNARDRNASLNGQISGLQGDLDTQMSETEKIMARVSRLQLGPLPMDVEQALAQLALRHSEVLAFDAGQGMLRFASDFTFALGATTLKSQAAEAIALVANILNSDAASQFEVQVVGHTDNVPIRNVGTRAKHPTNMHLSVHRAIAVRDSLSREGVIPSRIQVAGYGEHRPVVPNRVGGAAQNRRVEIFLVPMKTTSTVAPIPATSAAQPKPAAPEPMK